MQTRRLGDIPFYQVFGLVQKRLSILFGKKGAQNNISKRDIFVWIFVPKLVQVFGLVQIRLIMTSIHLGKEGAQTTFSKKGYVLEFRSKPQNTKSHLCVLSISFRIVT